MVVVVVTVLPFYPYDLCSSPADVNLQLIQKNVESCVQKDRKGNLGWSIY